MRTCPLALRAPDPSAASGDPPAPSTFALPDQLRIERSRVEFRLGTSVIPVTDVHDDLLLEGEVVGVGDPDGDRDLAGVGRVEGELPDGADGG